MKNFGKFMTVVLAMVISPVINGFIFSKLWLWFIVPIFETNPLKLAEAIGLMFLINYLGRKCDKNVNDNWWEEFINSIFFLIIMAGFTLLFGWIVTLFL